MTLSVLDQWLARRMEGAPYARPSREQLEAWQFNQLRRVVSHAKSNSPFYKQHLAGVDIASIGSLVDFSSLPMMTADHLRDSPEQMLCVSQDHIERVVTLSSSGTTGPPKRIFYTPEDLEATREFFSWGMSNLVSAGDTTLLLMPADRPGGVGQLLTESLQRVGVRAVAHGILEDAEQALEQCLAERAQCIVGSAAHVNLLAAAWEAKRISSHKIRSVLLCWDAVPDAVVRNLERILGCRVFRHWGMIETGLGGAVECEPYSGMHIRETDVYLEIVSPENGESVQDGQFGELVISTPLKLGMPLIRYKTGDVGRILPERCDCGSPLKRLDPIVHRLDDGILVNGNWLLLRDLNERLYALPGVADFSVDYCDNRIQIVVCGEPASLAHDVRKDMESMIGIGQAIANGSIELNVSCQNSGIPAVAGLGKRRIRQGLRG
ncbi:DVU_1553 family AMP-dependent CoA ligase [Pseudodesulfovibrio sp. zrk46]|uniref:DVU_1553 family AMP-dependent CoA ligase n=1 Tax=Pseudodesulfovibrio sp. zrk46 TaxID=2725288 RepID=UPI0014499A55|nr:AMP-binding protein [Pseudodesulfovibrio sp. zrk46]QJB57423.1 phenylacetate--CoA ligase family protein [Pseudodesulfovibrio sp. zrk46]